eukprot:COSAG06_NODE_20329_length_799_cov_3.032857_1_plen_67_part_10
MMVAAYIKKEGGSGPEDLPRMDQHLLNMPEGLSKADQKIWSKEQASIQEEQTRLALQSMTQEEAST